MKLIIKDKMKNENSKQYVYRILKENILQLNLTPGSSISEVDVAKALNISRTPVREAFSFLNFEELLMVYPQKGSFISKINLEAVEEAFFMRHILEKQILKLACEQLSEENIIELEKNIYLQEFQLKFKKEPIKIFSLDNEFHKIIYNGVNKPRTWKAIQHLKGHYNRVRLLSFFENMDLDEIINQHKDILKLIKNKEIHRIDEVVNSHLSDYKDKIIDLKKDYLDYFLD